MMDYAMIAILIVSVEAVFKETTTDAEVVAGEGVGVEEAIVMTDTHEDIPSMAVHLLRVTAHG